MDNETLGGGDSALLALLGGPGEFAEASDDQRAGFGGIGRTLAPTARRDIIGAASSGQGQNRRLQRAPFLRR